LNKIKKILIENIWLKISVFNVFSVIARVGSGWVINVVIAKYLGPGGTSISEQFRNFLQTAQGLSTLGISEGVTKYSAKYQNNKKQLSSFLASAYKIVLITSIIISLAIISFSNTINTILFPKNDFTLLIVLLGILIPVFAINIILLAVLNGFQKYKKVTYINIIGQISSAILSVFLISKYGILGTLLLVLATQVVSFIATLFFIKSDMVEILKFSLGDSKNIHYKRLYKYIGMAMVTALTIPIFSILIRNIIFDFYPNDKGIHAGYWDAVKKISGLLLAFITPIFSLYYYPQLAKINTNKEYKLELKKFFSQIFPIFTVGIIVLYLLRHWATILFFSSEYTPMEELFAWQLSADFIKIISLSIAFMMLARAHVAYYISTEIGFWLVFYLLSKYFIHIYELKGITIAYFITYVLYLLTLIILYRKILFNKKEIRL
jgi:PST family polysaccharide transporter